MADRRTDHPDQRTVSARFQRAIGNSVVGDYGAALDQRALRYGGRSGAVLESVLRAAMCGFLFSIPGLLIEANAPLPVQDADAPPAQVTGDLGAEYGYQAVRLNDRSQFVLVKQGGRYALYQDLGLELHYETSPAQALERIRQVSQDLGAAIDALENGRLPGGDIPQILEIGGLTEAYRAADGIERDYASMGENVGDGGLLAKLKQAQAQWTGAGLAIAQEGYGYSAAQAAALGQEAPRKEPFPIMFSIIGAGALLGGASVFAGAAPGAIRRNRQRRKGM